jgi:hypothetical protein
MAFSDMLTDTVQKWLKIRVYDCKIDHRFQLLSGTQTPGFVLTLVTDPVDGAKVGAWQAGGGGGAGVTSIASDDSPVSIVFSGVTGDVKAHCSGDFGTKSLTSSGNLTLSGSASELLISQTSGLLVCDGSATFGSTTSLGFDGLSDTDVYGPLVVKNPSGKLVVQQAVAGSGGPTPGQVLTCVNRTGEAQHGNLPVVSISNPAGGDNSIAIGNTAGAITLTCSGDFKTGQGSKDIKTLGGITSESAFYLKNATSRTLSSLLGCKDTASGQVDWVAGSAVSGVSSLAVGYLGTNPSMSISPGTGPLYTGALTIAPTGVLGDATTHVPITTWGDISIRHGTGTQGKLKLDYGSGTSAIGTVLMCANADAVTIEEVDPAANFVTSLYHDAGAPPNYTAASLSIAYAGGGTPHADPQRGDIRLGATGQFANKQITTTGNITGGSITTSGNITGNFGTFNTGINTSAFQLNASPTANFLLKCADSAGNAVWSPLTGVTVTSVDNYASDNSVAIQTTDGPPGPPFAGDIQIKATGNFGSGTDVTCRDVFAADGILINPSETKAGALTINVYSSLGGGLFINPLTGTTSDQVNSDGHRIQVTGTAGSTIIRTGEVDTGTVSCSTLLMSSGAGSATIAVPTVDITATVTMTGPLTVGAALSRFDGPVLFFPPTTMPAYTRRHPFSTLSAAPDRTMQPSDLYRGLSICIDDNHTGPGNFWKFPHGFDLYTYITGSGSGELNQVFPVGCSFDFTLFLPHLYIAGHGGPETTISLQNSDDGYPDNDNVLATCCMWPVDPANPGSASNRSRFTCTSEANGGNGTNFQQQKTFTFYLVNLTTSSGVPVNAQWYVRF